jgi:aerobic-type carbon monoxide dehydrogenase small subunit (CoxS/CutS family)
MALLEMIVNGRPYEIETDPERELLYVLRDAIGLTGSKYGCGEGQCGACAVLVDGQRRFSCVTPVGEVGGKEVTTVEGLEQNGRLHPLQNAFLEEDAFQCGYCTPGMLMSALALLRANANPSADEIVSSMENNICRCGTYPRIVAAIHRAARTQAEG